MDAKNKYSATLSKGMRQIGYYTSNSLRTVLLSIYNSIKDEYSLTEIKHMRFTINKGESKQYPVIPELFVQLRKNEIASEELLKRSVQPPFPK
jgi:hypothetical protein